MGRHYKKFIPRKIFKDCQFCKTGKEPDYKEPTQLAKYIYTAGRITPRSVNSNCLKHQRSLAQAIKRARFLALLPFVQKP